MTRRQRAPSAARLKSAVRARLVVMQDGRSPVNGRAVEKTAQDGGYLRLPEGDEALSYQVGTKLTETMGVRLLSRANSLGVTPAALVREIIRAYLTA